MRKQQAASSIHAVRQDRDRVCEGRGHRGELALLVEQIIVLKQPPGGVVAAPPLDEVDLELR